MSGQQHTSSSEEVARRGDEIYQQTIKQQVEAQHSGKVVAIDITTAAFAIGDNAIDAAHRLRAQHPEAEVWFVRVGRRTLHQIGARPSAGRI